MPKLSGKRIIITGASRGLGQICAQSFAAQDAKLVLIARSEGDLLKVKDNCHNSSAHLALSADLTDEAQLSKTINAAQTFLGEIDAVLHTAGGGLGLRDPLLQLSDFNKLFLLNLGTAVAINRLVVPEMKSRKRGNLVHVGSIASLEAVGSVGYNTVKAGLAAYVRSLGRELASDNIVVTGILPGGFSAPGNAMERLEKNNPEAYRDFVDNRLPRKVMGQAEELLPLLSLLCSDEASMMSGTVIPVDAGEGKAYQY